MKNNNTKILLPLTRTNFYGPCLFESLKFYCMGITITSLAFLRNYALCNFRYENHVCSITYIATRNSDQGYSLLYHYVNSETDYLSKYIMEILVTDFVLIVWCFLSY